MSQEETKEDKQYYVFWKGEQRMGSVNKTDRNFNHMNDQFHMRLIQKDASGTEHWDVHGIKKKRTCKSCKA